MKTTLLILIVCFCLTFSYAQKIEISFLASAGVYHFSGASATGVSWFNGIGSTPNHYYTNNPYGSNGGFSYGAGLQAQHVSKGGFITGVQAGYDVLRSNENITYVYPGYAYVLQATFDYITENAILVKGKTHLQNESVNLSPYIGYRLKGKKINVDFMPGIDVAFNVSSYDKGKATGDDGAIYQTNNKLTDSPTDFRLKFGIAAGYKKWAITAGYIHGLTNFDKGVIGDGGPYIVHSELLRFGIIYRIF
jgi:hypothetical protein